MKWKKWTSKREMKRQKEKEMWKINQKKLEKTAS